MDDDMKYKGMLLELDKCLNQQEFEALQFLCKDIIKKREREKVKRPTDLWEQLETREKLGPHNLDFLKEIIWKSCDGKLDAKRIIERYEVSLSNGDIAVTPQATQVAPSPVAVGGYVCQPVQMQKVPPSNYADAFRREINFLTRHLGREWRFFMRTLGVSDTDMVTMEQNYRGSLREQIYECLVHWINANKGQVKRTEFVTALRDPSVERFDLASRLEDGDF